MDLSSDLHDKIILRHCSRNNGLQLAPRLSDTGLNQQGLCKKHLHDSLYSSAKQKCASFVDKTPAKMQQMILAQSRTVNVTADALWLTLSRTLACAACYLLLTTNPVFKLLAVLCGPLCLPVFGSYKFNTDASRIHCTSNVVCIQICMLFESSG